MAVSMAALLDDLQAETDAVGALVARLDDDSISTPTRPWAGTSATSSPT
jgi:hypothetical protein